MTFNETLTFSADSGALRQEQVARLEVDGPFWPLLEGAERWLVAWPYRHNLRERMGIVVEAFVGRLAAARPRRGA